MEKEKLFPILKENKILTNNIYEETKKVMWSMVEYKELQMMYSCALKEIETKFEILNIEFNVKYKRNPISNVSTRLKRNESVIKKLLKNNLEVNIQNIENNIYDMAGIRIVCSYIDDIYMLAEALLKQDDITLIQTKDYIKNPKPNGYRSLHLIVEVPIFLVDKKKKIKVEVQIRTIAMDFWASLEHQMKYKKDIKNSETIIKELKECAKTINDTDNKMMKIRNEISEESELFNDDETLFDRIKKLDVPVV